MLNGGNLCCSQGDLSRAHSCTELRAEGAAAPHRLSVSAGLTAQTSLCLRGSPHNPLSSVEVQEALQPRPVVFAAMSEFLVALLGERLVNSEKAEVDVQSLGARLSLLGLFFGCSLNAPCKQFNGSLCEFYHRFKKASEHKDKLEIVFVSSDQDQKHWQDFLQEMPWPALPFKDRHKKMKLWNKYKVTSIPSLVFVDATTGKVVCRNGLLVVRDDPKGLEFPWGPKPFAEVVAGPLLRNNRQTTDCSSLEGHYVGVYFSAHWCPPCRSLTRVLVESYRIIKESGHKFEIVFVSADRSEESFKQYFSEMPWLAIPYSDEARRSRLNRLYGIQGIPTLILLDADGHVITRQGRVEVLNDPECRLFPWHPRPVLELSEANAVQLHEGPCLVLFVDAEEEGELEPAKELIQPIAEKLLAKYKAKEEETPLLFFVAGEDDMSDSLRDYTNLPEAAPLLTILDMSARAKYVRDVEEITPAVVEQFVNEFLAEKLKPEPI
uniref:Nucleoredoxin n=3 Tax=Cyprinodon variegatus TaxID=28743 RepID=A0A3Q2DB49_CYPVA